MAVNFFIPKQINVGFQERGGTYTGKLAYIIYFDEKGKLRKEVSWNSWRDKKIDNEIHDNEPMSGFVLNKKAGGYSYGWNHRQTYVRVYDPRGFEFEITVPNLLYILENATSTKGKGLEGEFVYGWDGKDLVLIPVDAPDYKELVKLNELRHSDKKIGARDLKIGATYRTKQNEEWIYMGKYDTYTSYYGEKKKKPSFWFYYREGTGYHFEGWRKGEGTFNQISSVPQKLVEVISEECVADYADIFDKMERNTSYSPIDESKTVYELYTFEEFEEKLHSIEWGGLDVFPRPNEEEDEGRKSRTVYARKNPETGKTYYRYEGYEMVEREYGSAWKRYTQLVRERVVNESDSLQEVFDIMQPCKKYLYLENGKFHREEKY